jgi:hypothetical protein
MPDCTTPSSTIAMLSEDTFHRSSVTDAVVVVAEGVNAAALENHSDLT